MIIGIPKEVRAHEGRVALTPPACAALVRAGNEVCMESTAGLCSGYMDTEYADAGVKIIADAGELHDISELIVKVKEPQPDEVHRLKKGQLLFCYLHLAAEQELVNGLLESGVTAIGFEIIQQQDGGLPLLAPMSIIAGRLAAHIGITLLHSHRGGRGLLLGALKQDDAEIERGNVTVLGAGNAGEAAMLDLISTGADLHVFDINMGRLQALKARNPSITICDAGSPALLRKNLQHCDLLIGAVLVPGKRAPQVVSREMVATMPKKSVIVDIAIDQGGCVETSRPTHWDNPTFIEQDVNHFCVTNMPGAVARTSTQALSATILPYVSDIAAGKLMQDPALRGGIYLSEGKIQYSGLS